MNAVYWVVGAVALQRLIELTIARRNTVRLKAAGAREVPGDNYSALVALHVAWLGAIVLFVPAGTSPDRGVLAAYAALQGVRIWTMASLGRFWTTRLVTLPGAQLVRRGPYRYLRHPNYVIVAAEIALLPLAFDAWQISLTFSIINAFLLMWRIKIENRALAVRAMTVL
jgi:methyltransferase